MKVLGVGEVGPHVTDGDRTAAARALLVIPGVPLGERRAPAGESEPGKPALDVVYRMSIISNNDKDWDVIAGSG